MLCVNSKSEKNDTAGWVGQKNKTCPRVSLSLIKGSVATPYLLHLIFVSHLAFVGVRPGYDVRAENALRLIFPIKSEYDT